MELFTIDGRFALYLQNNKSPFTFTEMEEKSLTQKAGSAFRSALRFRKKTLTTVVYLNIMKRKRMLELISRNNLPLN